ncbi:hypothetical protein [Kibdelosporangium aridum]|uniref:Uncharacterized protein n=1 Tax=Kibdelosporangium aridum TaxID=2030 RepID=A0A1Y5YCI6_KIBAR|nr:hypothetical protein [Kibdelosporangium aridum]SMD27062.1 hypothetical protein SAMN05661093_10659 [Kibdelosporangium aridum]
MSEFTDKQRQELVDVLLTVEASEGYMRACDRADAARYGWTRPRASPLTVRLETASLILRALLTTTPEPTSTTRQETPE